MGLAKLVNEKGNGDLSMMMGLGVVGATYTNKSAAKLSDTTPIARLIEEPSGIMVAKDSPYQSISDLVKAWKANPKMAVGGGSNPGGPDHLLPMQLAQAVGIDAKTVNFVSYDGGGDLLPAILGNKIGFATSGTGEYLDQIKSGSVRVLATTGEKRLGSLPEVQDAQGAGRGPGLHELARRRGPSRHQRRRQGQVGRASSTRCTPARRGRTRRPRTAGPTPTSAVSEFASFLDRAGQAGRRHPDHPGPGPAVTFLRGRAELGRGACSSRWSASSCSSTGWACPPCPLRRTRWAPRPMPLVRRRAAGRLCRVARLDVAARRPR